MGFKHKKHFSQVRHTLSNSIYFDTKNAKNNSKCQPNAKTLIALAVAANPALKSAVPTKPAVVVAAMDATVVMVAAILNAANNSIKCCSYFNLVPSSKNKLKQLFVEKKK